MSTQNVRHTWASVDDAMRGLTATQRELVMRDMACASAYVWGWQDGRSDETDTQTATEFGYAYALHSIDWHAERRCFKHNLGSAWSRFVAGEDLA